METKMNVKLIFLFRNNKLASEYLLYRMWGRCQGKKRENPGVLKLCEIRVLKWRYDDKIGADNLIETVITVLGDQRRNISCRINIWHMWVITHTTVRQRELPCMMWMKKRENLSTGARWKWTTLPI